MWGWDKNPGECALSSAWWLVEKIFAARVGKSKNIGEASQQLKNQANGVRG